jgi:hypothetical protein
MANKINNSADAATDIDMPDTFEEAEDLGAFELASRWADRLSWPTPLNRSASDDLAELACMSALARWLVRWQPIQVHRAVLAGAGLEAVAAALGGSVEDAFRLWHPWAVRQRESVICGKPGVTAEEFETVARAFAICGYQRARRGAALPLQVRPPFRATRRRNLGLVTAGPPALCPARENHPTPLEPRARSTPDYSARSQRGCASDRRVSWFRSRVADRGFILRP